MQSDKSHKVKKMLFIPVSSALNMALVFVKTIASVSRHFSLTAWAVVDLSY